MDFVRTKTNNSALTEGSPNCLLPTARSCAENVPPMNAMTRRHSLAVTAPALRKTLPTSRTTLCLAPRICSHHVLHAGSHAQFIPNASTGLGTTVRYLGHVTSSQAGTAPPRLLDMSPAQRTVSCQRTALGMTGASGHHVQRHVVPEACRHD